MGGSSCRGAYAARLPQLRTPDASSTVEPASHEAQARTTTNVVFQIARGTRVSRVRHPGVADRGVGYGDHRPEVAPGADDEHEPHRDDHLGLQLRRAGPPQGARADHGDADDEGGQAGPHPQRGDDQYGEDAGEHRRGPTAHREPHHDCTDDTGSRVARPGREHPAETPRRAHGDGVPGHVTAQDEAGEPAAAQHPDTGMAELVDEGDPEAQHPPQRLDRHRHEGRDEHDDHRGARQGDALLGHDA